MNFSRMLTALVLWALAVHAALCDNQSRHCATGLVVDVSSRRNASGHRHIKADVSMDQSRARKGEVNLHVEQDMCDASNQFHMSTVIIAPEPAPPGYELVPGLGWYRLHLKPLQWEEARLACETEGAHLAVLNSPQEAEALKGIMSRVPADIPDADYSYVFFIGYSDVVEGRYYTLFGETLTEAGYADWDKSQPNNAGGPNNTDSDCGGVNRTGKLNDMPCLTKMAYICEYHH